jgi:hypothetical protein
MFAAAERSPEQSVGIPHMHGQLVVKGSHMLKRENVTRDFYITVSSG